MIMKKILKKFSLLCIILVLFFCAFTKTNVKAVTVDEDNNDEISKLDYTSDCIIVEMKHEISEINKVYDESFFGNIDIVGNLVQQMIEKVEQVDEVATNVAAISEEQAASSEEILVTAENMATQAEKITQNSQMVADGASQLTASAQQLTKEVDNFKVEKGEL